MRKAKATRVPGSCDSNEVLAREGSIRGSDPPDQSIDQPVGLCPSCSRLAEAVGDEPGEQDVCRGGGSELAG